MVTNPNWMAPFHIARAMQTSWCRRSPADHPVRGVGTVTIAHQRKRTPCGPLLGDDERIKPEERRRRLAENDEADSVVAAVRERPGEDDEAAGRAGGPEVDRRHVLPVDVDLRLAVDDAPGRDDGQRMAGERERHARAFLAGPGQGRPE